MIERRRLVGLGIALLALGILAFRGLLQRSDEPAPDPTAEQEEGQATSGPAGPSYDDVEALLAEDPRLQRYLGEYLRDSPWTENTDALSILVQRLARSSSPEPLSQAKYELGRMGEEAVPELRRFIEERAGKPELAPQVQNALEALHQMDVGVHGVRQLFGDALQHPQEMIRRVAIRGLAKHADIYEFDALFDLCTRSVPGDQRSIVAALHTADPARLEEYLADQLTEPGLEAAWSAAAALLGPCLAVSAERFEQLAQSAPPAILPYFAACRALHGDEQALTRLRELLTSENPSERTIVARALTNEGLVDELMPLLEDPDPSLRVLAIDTLGEAGESEARRTAIAARLGDKSPDVRRLALATLVAWNDPAATDRALEALKGKRGEYQDGLLALQRRWDDDPELARRALDILIALRDERSHRAPKELQRLENGIASVPLPDAARYLLELGRAYPIRSKDARTPGWRNHRHFAFKAGARGRDVLRERWDVETDPLRRMDLVEGMGLGETDAERDAMRAFLISILRSDRVHPYEQLQASMRLARMGPVEDVAPVLKRATLDVSHPEVRRAMQGLLWDWYGQ